MDGLYLLFANAQACAIEGGDQSIHEKADPLARRILMGRAGVVRSDSTQARSPVIAATRILALLTSWPMHFMQ